MSTNKLSAKAITRTWYQVDAANKVLGRLASDVATKLMGKHKANYVPYLDSGDYVIVTNASKVKVTGNKAEDKNYVRHSGYPGGKRTETFAQLQVRRPEEIIRHAVKGMLPKSKLGRSMIKKLHIYAGSEHPYQSKLGGQG
jgi:large subunit ribosomal protein L13